MIEIILSCLLSAGSGDFHPPEGWEVQSVSMRGNDCSHLYQGCEDNPNTTCSVLTVMCYPKPFSTRVVIKTNQESGEVAIPKGCDSPNVVSVEKSK